LKKIPKVSPTMTFFRRDDFSYEKKLHEPKKLYYNVHHINIEVLEKKKPNI
jgi:hypothetical protein